MRFQNSRFVRYSEVMSGFERMPKNEMPNNEIGIHVFPEGLGTPDYKSVIVLVPHGSCQGEF